MAELRYKDVLKQMLDLIDSGEFPAGSRLPPERALTERFGVSRPTIRQAITAMEAMNRVEVKTGSGVYVLEKPSRIALEHDNISPFELTEARAMFEGEVAALAAMMITDDELAMLDQSLMDMADESNDEADQQFHQIISQATRNQAIVSVVDDLWYIRDHSPRVKQAYQAVCEVNASQRLEEHREIYDALLKRDPHAARVAMHRHFARLLDKLLDATEARAVEDALRESSESRKRFSPDRLLGSQRA